MIYTFLNLFRSQKPNLYSKCNACALITGFCLMFICFVSFHFTSLHFTSHSLHIQLFVIMYVMYVCNDHNVNLQPASIIKTKKKTLLSLSLSPRLFSFTEFSDNPLAGIWSENATGLSRNHTPLLPFFSGTTCMEFAMKLSF